MNREDRQKDIAGDPKPVYRFSGASPTGRLLLGRKAYEMDMELIIAEAARCQVAIELNANPARLDLDWRWGGEMRKRGTMTSINPDAHEVDGLGDTRYGVAMARKDCSRWIRSSIPGPQLR